MKAVVFDVDGTLYRQGPLRRAMAWRLVRSHVWRPLRALRTARIISAYRRAQEELREASAAGDLAEAQLSLVVGRTGAGRDEVARCVERWMERAPLDLLPGLVQPGLKELLRGLKAHATRLAVLSDYPAGPKLQALGLEGFFAVVLCAQQPEIGVFKPHPRGLLVALERLGVAAGDALYVGDRADVDAAAAAAAGMRCAILSHRRAAADAPDCLTFTGYGELRDWLMPT